MGQKINPISFRVGVTEPWRSRWFAGKKTFGRYLVEDARIRRYIKSNYRAAAISKIEIERTGEETRITLHTARPGIVIGRRGAEVDKLRDELEGLCSTHVSVNIKEIPHPEVEAQLIAEAIADEVSKRASYKRAMKRAAELAMAAGAAGVRIRMAGRLAGSEMARTEDVRMGKIPLQTIRARVDYGFTEAATAYGNIGIKVWTYLGEQTAEERHHGADAQAG